MTSIIWFIRGMPRVVMFRTWVSPRWKRPEPWAVGMSWTSADRGRRSEVPRPSMRIPSSTIRVRTIFLVSERTAALISRVRSGKDGSNSAMTEAVASSSAALRSAFWVMALALVIRSVPTATTCW